MVADLCRCQYCGQPTDRPQLFTPSVQRVFNYIWDNPGCTVIDIEIGLYGRRLGTNTVSQAITRIRNGFGNTGYKLLTRFIPELPRVTRAIYEISKLPSPIKPSVGKEKTMPQQQPTTGPTNVTS